MHRANVLLAQDRNAALAACKRPEPAPDIAQVQDPLGKADGAERVQTADQGNQPGQNQVQRGQPALGQGMVKDRQEDAWKDQAFGQIAFGDHIT